MTSAEMVAIRKAWSGVVGLIATNPLVLPQRTDLDEVQAAVPELAFLQPRGIHRTVVMERKTPVRMGFAQDLAVVIGTASRWDDDLAVIYENLKFHLDQPAYILSFGFHLANQFHSIAGFHLPTLGRVCIRQM